MRKTYDTAFKVKVAIEAIKERFHQPLDYRTPEEMHRSFVLENPLPFAAWK